MSTNPDNLNTKTPFSAEDEDVSGSWIRDQLRDVADVSPEAAQGDEAENGADLEFDDLDISPPEPSNESLLVNLANSVSQAVLEPMMNIEKRRASEADGFNAALREQTDRLSSTIDALGRAEGLLAKLVEQVERHDELLRERLEDANNLSERLERLGDDLRKDDVELLASLDTAKGELSASLDAAKGELSASLEAAQGELSASQDTAKGELSERLEGLEKTIEEQGAELTRLGRLEVGQASAAKELAGLTDGLQKALSALSSTDKEG